ncbi:EF-P beta-lysylation protein EpmB [Aquimonas voraii]|uniref:L-lysine 2,3-aminomutase n=1 Tax=Aquimonas voraii TaxID=265719 RepID=A0A1G6RR80_9GAMM|nr:EF-P beta-lysylation protein EpmB [Aquimonas voraii]SDD07048.1 L-lysine 2,3-aminomutase [Aquimonas voraii]
MISANPRIAQPGAAEGASADWRRLWREAVTDPLELLHLLGLETLAERLPAGAAGFPLRVPRGFVARMRHGDPADPLLRQVLPLDLETLQVEGFGLDAVGDAAARSGRGVLQKYQGRALLVATGSCAVHCRYCFRRHYPYGEDSAAANAWQAALDTIEADPSVDEVILSGGDPLSLSTAKLRELGERLLTLPQVRRLRIHSRLPVVLPERVDADLLDWLTTLPLQKVMVIHANHAREFDASVAQALASLRGAGLTVLNQAVLLRGINDTAEAQVELAEASFAAGALPYYLHQLDRVAGAAHFEVPEAEALALEAALRGRLPGYLVPKLVREVAGASSKLPLALTTET